jgi:carbon storage regulator
MLARAPALWNRQARTTLEYLHKDEIMLVLSREVGEGIKIGDQIEVTVVRISSGVVRIGIEAPSATPIFRAELQEELEIMSRESIAEPQ